MKDGGDGCMVVKIEASQETTERQETLRKIDFPYQVDWDGLGSSLS